jgi:hypothetical protein
MSALEPFPTEGATAEVPPQEAGQDEPTKKARPRKPIRYATAAGVIVVVLAAGIGTGYALSGASDLRSQRNTAQATVKSYQTELGTLTDQLNAAKTQVDTDNTAIATDMRGWNACKNYAEAEQNAINTSQSLWQELQTVVSTVSAGSDPTADLSKANQLYNQMQQQIGMAAGQGSSCSGA